MLEICLLPDFMVEALPSAASHRLVPLGPANTSANTYGMTLLRDKVLGIKSNSFRMIFLSKATRRALPAQAYCYDKHRIVSNFKEKEAAKRSCSNSSRMITFANVRLQTPWNDTLAKKGGEGVARVAQLRFAEAPSLSVAPRPSARQPDGSLATLVECALTKSGM